MQLPEAVEAALRRVVDPETALNIVDLGLVYDAAVDDHTVSVRLTMTSAACPVAELIVEEAQQELVQAYPRHEVKVDLCWKPPWTPASMTERGRALMGWD